MLRTTYAQYEIELYDDNHIYEWETWSAFLEDGLFTFCWTMIEKAPNDGMYRNYWKLDQENTDKLLQCIMRDDCIMIPKTASGWGDQLLQMEKMAKNILDAAYEHFNGPLCKKRFFGYCKEHDVVYQEYWG